MAFEDGFVNQLNLGSESALESAAPTPVASRAPIMPMDETPAGFGGQGVLSKPESITPPAYYHSSPNSLAGQEGQGLFSKIVGAMMNAGTRPGDLPVTTKLNLAQAEISYKKSQTELAWQNYHKSQQIFENLVQQQRKDNITTAYGLMPGAIAQIRAASTPEARAALVKGHAASMKAIAPGTEIIIEEFGRNPFHVGMWQAAAADFNNPAAKQLRELIDTNGLEHVLQMPEGKALMTIMGHDGAASVVGGFGQKDSEKLHSGKMNEEEFRTLYKKRMYDPEGLGWTPQLATAMESFLDTPEGEQFMVGKGVRTNQTLIALQKKEKPSDIIGAKKNERFEKNEALIDFDLQHPGVIEPAKVQLAKEQNDVALGYLQKQSNVGINPNNSVEQRFRTLTGDKYNTSADIDSLPEGSEKEIAKHAFVLARAEQDKAASTAAMGARMGAQHDLVTKPVFKMDSAGNIARVTGDLTEEAYRKGGSMFTMSEDQKQKMGTLRLAKDGGKNLFDAADKAFKKNKTGLDQAKAVSNEMLMSTRPGQALVANTDPDLFNYVSQRDSALGKYARSLGGEVGVLTDQDIARVVKMFPNASDTDRTRLAKRKAFDALIKINEDALKMALIGNKDSVNEGVVSPEQLEALKHDPAIQSKINGILGSIEGLSAENKGPISAPSAVNKTDNRSRAERLAEEMRK